LFKKLDCILKVKSTFDNRIFVEILIMPYVEKMNKKDKEEGDILGGSNGGDKK